MDVKVNFSVTEKENMKFYVYNSQALTCLSALVFAWIVIIGIDVLAQKVNMFAVYLVSGGTVVVLLSWLVTYLTARKAWKTNAQAKESFNCTFTDVGIHSESKTGTGDLSYDTIYKVCETKTAFYMYLSSAFAIVMPKRCFENAEDVRRVREFFVKNVDKKKLRLKNEKSS